MIAVSPTWIAVAVSLVLRILYFIQIRGNPFFDTPIMDEGYHDLWAREIAGGDWTTRLPFFRAPLYPFLLGAAYRVFGPDLGLIRLLQLRPRLFPILLPAARPLRRRL